MIKKISAIFLALVLCISTFMVPASAAGFDSGYTLPDGAQIAFKVELDKEYYSAGDTATISIYALADDALEYGAGAISIGVNTSVFNATDNTAATIKASATSSDVYNTFYKAASSSTWSYLTNTTNTNYKKIYNNSTAEEQAMYNGFVKIVIARNMSGDHENAGLTTNGIYGSDFNSSTDPIITFQLKVASDVADGTVVNVGIPSGSYTEAAAQTYINVFSDPGNATTAVKTNTDTTDATYVKTTATIGKEPCADDAHVWDNGVETTAPTCGEAGVKTYTCSVCKHTKTEEISATGNHTAAEAVKENEVAASCSVAGSYESVVYCSVCNTEMSRDTITVDATGAHVYATETDRKEATCTEDGYVVKACGCGATETTTIPMTGHTEEEIPAVDATCTTDGATAGVKCSVCDEVITAPTTIPSAGHTEETVVENEVAATCTTDGSYESVVNCTVCEIEISRETVVVPATGHSYGEGVQTKSATCEKPGETRYTCSACGYVDKRAEPAAKGHTEVVVPAVAPTCVNPGYEEGSVCSVCNATVVARKKIEPLGHTKNEGVVTPPTYSSQGYTTYNCTVCGVEFKDDIVGMLPINFAVAIQEPSITEIRCKDTIVLHAVTTTGEELPDDVTVVWTADNENFKTNEIDDGRALEITSKNKGNTVFTVTVYDVNGTVLSSDTVEMYSNAGFFAKIGGFFRTIFGLTKYYEA